MQTITAKWFECSVRYDKTMETGTQKKVTEQYVVDAVSFTEAETRIIEEIAPFVQGEFKITSIKTAQYKEVALMSDAETLFNGESARIEAAIRNKDGKELHKPLDLNTNNVDTKFYKLKTAYITLDEKTGEEKRDNVFMLVQAVNLRNALDNLEVVLKGSMIDYESVNINSTNILDVYCHTEDKRNSLDQLLRKMTNDIKYSDLTAEQIADKYTTCAEPEYRQMVIDKINELRGKKN